MLLVAPLLAMLVAFCVAVDNSFITILPAGVRNCFMEDLIPGRTLEFDFDVYQGGNLDINVQIIAPSGKMLYSANRKSRDTLSVPIEEEGGFQFCLDNSFSRLQYKHVSVDYYDDKPMEDYDTAYDELTGDIDDLEMKVADIFSAIDKLRSDVTRCRQFQAIRRSTEARDRTLLESNFSLINNASVLCAILMVISALTQIFFIRAMFSSKNTKAGTFQAVPNLLMNGFRS